MDERRQHCRLIVRLPIECYAADGPRDPLLRATTSNISTGGVYFEVDLTEGTPRPAPPTLLSVDLTVPPGDGHFPYEGRISSLIEVVRCEPLPGAAAPSETAPAAGQRLGIAARFREPLKYAF